MGFFSDIVDGITGGGDSGKASKKGAGISADATLEGAELSAQEILRGGEVGAGGQVRGRDYLLEQDRYPTTLSTDAVRRLGGVYGLEGGRGSQQQLINRARRSPIYNAIMQTRDSGEDAILRNASATGGLRSGDASSNLYQYNQELEANALLSAYGDQLSGLQYMSQLPTHDLPIAQSFAQEGNVMGQAIRDAGLVEGQGIAQAGQLRGQGEVAAAQAQQAGRGGFMDLVSNLGGAAIMKWSDPALKTNVERLGECAGLPWYRWEWNEDAASLDLSGAAEGFMAHEVAEVHPEAVGERDGFLTVDYGRVLEVQA